MRWRGPGSRILATGQPVRVFTLISVYARECLALDVAGRFRGTLDFGRSGKPVDHSVCEAFNGTLRRECLTCHWFASLAEAQVELAICREDYNNHRPHTSLGLKPRRDIGALAVTYSSPTLRN